jgi:glycosyltransferase involved in cell wall biosynthesis
MKVLYFHQHFNTPEHYSSTRSYEFSRKLINKGHSVCIVCGESARLKLPPTKTKNVYRGTIDGIDVIQIALPYSNSDGILKRAITFIRFAWHGIQIVLKEEYDLLFATSTPLTVGIPGIIGKTVRKKKFIFEVRDLWPELPKALGMKNPFLIAGMSLLECLSYHCADACIGLSPGICEGIKRRSQKGKPVELIPNGCDLELFKPSNSNSCLLKDSAPKDSAPQEKIAVFTGAHGVANGLDAVLDAASLLKKRGREDIVLVFIGDGKQKKQLEQRAKEENLNNCRFYAPVPKRELARIIASADIGLMILANIPAFYYGTSPNKFFDYISAGLPVLNNYPGWLAGMINENQLGVAVSPGNPESFANGLIKLSDDREFRKECGQNARRFAENNFSRENLSDNFVSFLEKIYFSEV